LTEIKFDNRLRPALQIIKVDEETNEPLAGAVFHVRKTEGLTVSEYITDESGTILINDLDEDIYSVVEIKAPDGYLLDSQQREIQLEWGTAKTLVFMNKARPKLEILKVDEETNEPLAGAIFRVNLTEGNTLGEFTTDETGRILLEDLEDKIYSVQEILAPDGYLLNSEIKTIELEWGATKTLVFTNKARPKLEILKVDEETNEPLAGAIFRVNLTEGNTLGEFTTDETGRILLEDLEDKIYSVQEIVAPDGYLLDSEIKTVELEWGVTKTLIFTNKARPKLEILKVDEETNEPLAGAIFRVSITTGNVVGEFTTDEEGRVLIEDLDNIIYTVEEIVAPHGYLLEPQLKTVELEWGATKTLIFTNKARPKLRIQKVDANTGEFLRNAEFRVEKLQDSTVSEFILENGEIILENLDEAIYRATEFMPPNGYVLLTESKEIMTEWGKTKTLKFDNIRKPVVVFLKSNGLTGRPIEGATFRVEYEQQSGGIRNLGNFRTGADGRITIPKAEVGWYIFTEIMPAPGFSLPSNPVTRMYFAAGDNAYNPEFAQHYTAGTGRYASGYAPNDGITELPENDDYAEDNENNNLRSRNNTK